MKCQSRTALSPNQFNIFMLSNFLFILLFCLQINQAKTLDQEANLALDKLTSVITTLNLERVRQIKSRLVAITGRVQKVDY
jgi:hypothetical protein